MDPNIEIKLVCFDLGGVLIRIAQNWQEVLDRAGISHDQINPSDENWQKHQQILELFETGKVDEDHYFNEAADCFDGVSKDQFIVAFDSWTHGLFPGVEKLLKSLNDRAIRTACLSNTNARHWGTCLGDNPHYASLKRLDLLFASHHIGHMKPADPIYDHVEKHIGISPSSIVFFDDLAENVQAAQSRGWLGHQVDPADDPVAQIHLQLRSLGLL